MTALDVSRTTLPQARGAARRAVARWAIRLFRREWRQQGLVLALLSVAVAATTVGIALAASAAPSEGSEFGRARTIIDLPGTSDRLADNIAALRTLGTADTIAHGTVTAPGAVDALDVRDQDPSGALGATMLRLVDGRYPAAPGEVALTDDAAAQFGVAIGDTVPIGGVDRTMVGTVENPLRLSDEFVLVAPGALGDEVVTVAVLLDVGDDALRDFRLPDGSGLGRKTYSTLAASQAAAAVLAIASIGMLFVGMLAAAGFAVMAQRRLRSLGMLGAIGATDRQVRSVLLASGAVIGLTAAAVGVGTGLGGWAVGADALEPLVDHRIDRFDLPWWSVGATVALALGTAVAAAWWPARSAARTSVMAALSGRPPALRPARGFAAAGVACGGVGISLLYFSQRRGSVAVVAGTLATMVGVLLLAPLGVRALGALAPRSPVPARLALRDLVRYRARSGAAVGAVALALGIAAVVSISAAAAAAGDRASGVLGNLPVGDLVVHLGSGRGTRGGPVPQASAEELASARTAVAEIAAIVGASDTVELQAAVDPDAPLLSFGPTTGRPAAALVEPERGSGEVIGYRWRAALYVATPGVLRYAGIDPAAVSDAEVVTVRRDLGTAELSAPLGRTEGAMAPVTHPPTVAVVDLPAYSSQPTTLLTESAMTAMGLRPATVAWAVRSGGALADADLTAVLRTAAAAGLSVETPQPGPSYGTLRTSATGVGLLVALGVLAMTVGLIRSESAGDVRLLATVGASGRTRRSVVGVTAAALGLVGGVLGTTGAYAALLAWHHHDLAPLRDVPVAELAAIVVGLPALAAVGGWLLSGGEPAVSARSPLA